MQTSYARWFVAFVCLSAFTLVNAADAGTPGAADVIANLQKGGYVLLMRHAHSPAEAPGKNAANKDNIKSERQLDATGRDTAHAMGDALKTLRIPIGSVLSSPTYRALETIRLAGLGKPVTFSELGDGGTSMSAKAVSAWASWLKAKVAEHPQPGANTIIVTQMPNIAAAFPNQSKALSDGETLIFRPNADGATSVARIKIEDWPALAAAH